MAKLNIIFFSFITLLVINSSSAKEYFHKSLYPPNDTVYDCYITDLYKAGNAVYIKIRPIQFLWFSDAIEEARKDGVCEYNIDEETKDTLWFVSNDYYLNDESSTTELKIRLSKLVNVSIYDQAVLKKITINELLLNPSYYKDKYSTGKTEEIYYSPCLITLKKGKVILIQETYVP